MKKFSQFLTEHDMMSLPSGTGLSMSTAMHDSKDARLARILGELRMVGIHAGDRDSQQPYTATRSMMALSGAAQRIQGVLMPHGLFIGQPHFVVRESADQVRMKFHIYETKDESRRVGELDVLGEVDGVNRGTMSFRADLKFPPDYLWKFFSYSMAQYRLDNKQLGQPGNRYEVVMVADKWGNVISNPANPQGMAVDSFGRMRVAQPYTLFDSQHRYREGQQWDAVLTGSATKTYDLNSSSVVLTVTGANNDQAVYETRRVFPYQPGKSLHILNTFTLAPAHASLRQRTGYFSSTNGIYFEQNGTTNSLNLVVRSSANGTVVENRVAQANWNGDKFDGTGHSERVLDITKTQIFFTDIEWLGVGAVRCGFMVDGVPYVAHTFYHDNRQTLPYMQTATLPLRYEITRTATNTGNASLRQICSTVISEGGYEPDGAISSAGMKVSYKTFSANTETPAVSVRLNSNTLDAVVILSQLDVIVESTNKDKNVFFRVIKNATLTNPGFLLHDSTLVDYDINATAVSGGTEVMSGYITAGRASSIGTVQNFRNQLGRFANGTAEVYTLTLRADSIISAAAQLGWFTVIG